MTAREAVTPASLASAAPLLLALCPHGSGNVSSHRSFQSCPGAAFRHAAPSGAPIAALKARPQRGGTRGGGKAPGASPARLVYLFF